MTSRLPARSHDSSAAFLVIALVLFAAFTLGIVMVLAPAAQAATYEGVDHLTIEDSKDGQEFKDDVHAFKSQDGIPPNQVVKDAADRLSWDLDVTDTALVFTWHMKSLKLDGKKHGTAYYTRGFLTVPDGREAQFFAVVDRGWAAEGDVFHFNHRDMYGNVDETWDCDVVSAVDKKAKTIQLLVDRDCIEELTTGELREFDIATYSDTKSQGAANDINYYRDSSFTLS